MWIGVDGGHWPIDPRQRQCDELLAGQKRNIERRLPPMLPACASVGTYQESGAL